jgi:hypothetical protein
MCYLYVELHKGDMWQQDDNKPNSLSSSTVNKKITSLRLLVVVCNLWKRKRRRWRALGSSSSSIVIGKNKAMTTSPWLFVIYTLWKKHTKTTTCQGLVVIFYNYWKKKEKMTRSPWFIVIYICDWQKKHDNEPDSLLSYVVTHEENKLEDDNEPSGSSSSFDLLL